MTKFKSFLAVLFCTAILLAAPMDGFAGKRGGNVTTTSSCECPTTTLPDLCPGYCDDNEWSIYFDGGSFCQWTKETCVQDGAFGTCQGSNTTRPYPCSDGPPR